jgi:hypothetical protein
VNRIMLDAIGAHAPQLLAAVGHREYLGAPATMGAGYGDGPVSAWTSAEWVNLTTALGRQPPVVITVTGQTGPHRHVADVENGDLTPEGGAAWAAQQHAAGFRPVIYCNRSNKAAVLASLDVLGLKPAAGGPGLWVATLDGTFTDLDGSQLAAQPGVVAVQYAGASLAGGPWDVSVVTDESWMPVPADPAPPPWQAQALASAEEIAADLASLVGVLKAHQ